MKTIIHTICLPINLLGAAVIVLGLLRVVIAIVRSEIQGLRGESIQIERARLRADLGYYLLLGLEILIAADILETIGSPTQQKLLLLGVIVVLRTILSYSLSREMRDLEELVADAADQSEASKSAAE